MPPGTTPPLTTGPLQNNAVARDPLREAIRAAHRMDETACISERLKSAALPPERAARISTEAAALVQTLRDRRSTNSPVEAFMRQYGLSSQEGVLLMCLAEALLRIPDSDTADALIRDKLGGADWTRHLGRADDLLVNASSWALVLTGELLRRDVAAPRPWHDGLRQAVARLGEPVIRAAIRHAMRMLGDQFVLGESIQAALRRARDDEANGYRHSFDMLGEAARTMADADRYLAAYSTAIAAIGKAGAGRGPVEGPGISVKLSALHPRYEFAQRHRVMTELLPRLIGLCREAKAANIGLTIDAEEADRLDLSLDLIEALAEEPSLRGWQGLGLAVQAYQKRALPLVEWLIALGRRCNRRWLLRLVKGAYWDSEIKWAQVGGFDGYPVFTRKAATDVSYLACACAMLAASDAIYPAFATHNAHTIAAIVDLAEGRRDFEFQRLHGMGEALHDRVVARDGYACACRIYAPVGSHQDLLAYLVRRLLENGANSSFVHRVGDRTVPVSEIAADPVSRLAALEPKPNPRIPLPRDIYGPGRKNANGFDLNAPDSTAHLLSQFTQLQKVQHAAAPIIGGRSSSGNPVAVTNPANRREAVGQVVNATPRDAAKAFEIAAAAQHAWSALSAKHRADCLRRAADLYENEMLPLMSLAVREAGKTWADAVAEIREAVDFLRYYAAEAERLAAAPQVMPGPTGERNELTLHGRGVFVCISPWNFPLAIFTGQIAAALAAGNAVLAKPAPQTPLIAAAAVRLLHQAGIPGDILHLLPGGPELGAVLIGDPRVAGVCFTGSTAVARKINRALAAKDGPIVPLIAETGGVNAMIVDSSALPEQVVRDVITSAFQSAGQRCSALRLLCLQEDVADRMIEMLAGAMAELQVGDPAQLATDIGPVIDAQALQRLQTHAAKLDRAARLIARARLSAYCENGTFLAPAAYEIPDPGWLREEVFGPLLHVARFRADALDQLLDAINGTGYGLTLSIHSRIDATVARVRSRARVGNLYVNRNQIGAVVGVQPFGGEGLSGTGPKAGGPHYLARFVTERHTAIDTTAAGGNTSLLAGEE